VVTLGGFWSQVSERDLLLVRIGALSELLVGCGKCVSGKLIVLLASYLTTRWSSVGVFLATGLGDDDGELSISYFFEFIYEKNDVKHLIP